MRIKRPLQPETVSKYFLRVSFLNMVMAAAATAPVLVPQLGLPLKIQIWPGTWMLIAYFSFLIAGVLGVLAWSLVYYMLPRLFGIQGVSRLLSMIHLILFETGVVGAASLLGLIPGYVGGTLIHDGLGQYVVTRVIEWSVIPIGIFIAIAVLSTLVGIFNVLLFSESQRGPAAGVARGHQPNGPMRLILRISMGARREAPVKAILEPEDGSHTEGKALQQIHLILRRTRQDEQKG